MRPFARAPRRSAPSTERTRARTARSGPHNYRRAARARLETRPSTATASPYQASPTMYRKLRYAQRDVAPRIAEHHVRRGRARLGRATQARRADHVRTPRARAQPRRRGWLDRVGELESAGRTVGRHLGAKWVGC